MPSRIGFHVIYATSEVTQHPASELGWAGPASRGWRSAPGARAPHDLVLQLASRVAITRVQLLAHHYLIPKRIELLVHDSTGGEGVARTPSSPQYEAVGWVGLAEGGGAARELRTASVPPRPAAYLRLRLSEPHENEKNVFNQVALMGVNIFGIALDPDENTNKDGLANDINGKKLETADSEHYSPYDDLAFIMYVDNDIADIIRQLESKKQSAIAEERFEYARKIKVACDILGAGGRVIGGWQLQKRVAAATEQYERATRRRDAISVGRARLIEAVNLEKLLETNGLDPRNDEYSGDEKPFSVEMLIQCTSNLSFDSPSPPTVMQPMSSKNSASSYCSTNPNNEQYQNPSRPAESHSVDAKPNTNGILMDDNNIYYVNSAEDAFAQKSSYNQIRNDYSTKSATVEVCNGVERTISPFVNEHSYVEANSDNQSYLVENNAAENVKQMHSSHQANNANAEKCGKIFFEDQISYSNSHEMIVDENEMISKKNAHHMDVKKGEHGHSNTRLVTGACEGSYFNSPANSVSPTNLHYNAEVCRNGQGSPANSSRSSGQHKTTSNGSSLTSQSNTVVVKRRNRSAGPPPPAHHRSSYEAYEERLVPTLRHSHTNEYLRSYQIEQTEQQRGRSKLAERERKQAALPILIFGEELVEKIYSKHFAEKEDGLQRLKGELRSFDTKPPGGAGGPAALSPNKAARAAALLLHRALRDPVFSVYSLAAESTRVFFTEFIAGRVNSAEIGRSVERLVPELLTRAGDPAPRVHSLAMHTLLTMADCPPVRSLNIIPSYLVRPLTAGTAPRLALSRLLMVEQLLLNHGIDKNSGLKARAVAELGAGGLTHGQGAVRRAAERLLMAAYERAPRLVRGQLPPDDPVTRRNLLYRHLFEGFDRIDRRKQEETLGISQCEDVPTNKFESYTMNSMMMESMTASQMTNSMSSSMGSSMTGSLYQPKSSMKRQSSKKYNSSVGFNGVKADVEYPGYNKLRLDSAVSPKHQSKINKTAQNPRNYVLEKNWQNSIQNGNYCPQIEENYPVDTNKYQSIDISENSNKVVGTPKSNKSPVMSSTNNLNSLNNSNTFHKSSIVARNLHSSIVFDNKSSYSDSENVTAIENGVKQLHKTDSKKTSSDTIKSNTHGYGVSNGVHESPGGTLKKNKNIKNTIFRSKSGSNVPTCFDDNNYDSFDDSQVEAYEYCKGSREDVKNIVEDAKENYDSGTSTPEVCDKYEDNGQSNGDSSECPFCLASVAEGALDIHYWRTCPLLCRCTACRAPLEIRILSQHLTEDCPHSKCYRQCTRCTEAIEIENYQRHLADDDCIETTQNLWKCPLCHNNVQGDDESWRHHLTADSTAENPCTMNPRASPNK